MRAVAAQARGQHVAGVRAALALEQVEHRAAEDDRVARRRREGGRPALAKAGAHGGAEQRDLAGVVLGGALDQPGPAQIAEEAARPPGWRQARVVGGDHDLHVQALGGAAQSGKRVLAGGPAIEVGVVEHMQLVCHRPAGQVAPRRRGGRQASGGKEWVGGRQPAGRRVNDDRDPGRGLVESFLQAQAQVLERVKGALSAIAVLGLVPSDEAQRLRLYPGHPPSRLVEARTGPGGEVPEIGTC